MIDLLSKPAKICPTACAFLIHQSRILLVKHKKLQIWLAPGGHCENNEQPHQTAIRECYEETGNQVTVISAHPLPIGETSQYLPLPFAINLHNIYHGSCEQHVAYLYLVKSKKQLSVIDPKESDDIGWFTLNETTQLNTTTDIKAEIAMAFKLYNSANELPLS